jgi:anti-sigma-K factor RskA
MLIVEAVAPPASVWQAISARLAANDDAAPAASQAATRLWRTLTLVASAVAASLGLILVTRPTAEVPKTETTQPLLVASLQDEKTTTAVTISVEQAGGRLLITPVRLPSEGRAPELWIIPRDGTPRSLGVIRAGLPGRLTVPRSHQAHIHSGATFAITLEPLGGSPTGAPTGPITASGKIIRV